MGRPSAAGSRFDVIDLIRDKRDGKVLGSEAIDWLIGAYIATEIADEQMSALLMAIYFRGLSAAELSEWTTAMIASGERIDLSSLSRPSVDKHSTGGVGDKVSLILAPLVAACGVAVPQLSGRGLGHTGGTLDKLETIPGFRSSLDSAALVAQLEAVGCAICAAGPNLVPADRKLYALRDVTGTVESIPLIAASIMSKKIAEGTQSLVLDVKVGTGAFMTNADAGTELAETMVALGKDHGLKVSALLTAMDTPLGNAVGNAVEVEEALEVLSGGGPDDLVEVTLALAGEMLSLAAIDGGHDPGDALRNGFALDKYRAMIRAQGGDPDVRLPVAKYTRTVTAERSGYLARLDARGVGMTSWRLGAGRARKEDPVSAAAGVICYAKPGDSISAGDAILELRADSDDLFEHAITALEGAIEIADDPPEPADLILGRIT